MRTVQGKCEILMDGQIVVGNSVYCTITDSNGTMTISPELAGKLWIIDKVEKKGLYIKIHFNGKILLGRINITSSPAQMGKELSARINFLVGGELNEVQ
jgi:hypothetical protein